MASIRKRKWQGPDGEPRIAWMVDFIDVSGARARRQFDTRARADAFRVKVESEIAGGAYRVQAGKITLKDVSELFLEHCRGRMERRERMTRRNFDVYKGHVVNYICSDPARLKHTSRWLRTTPFGKGLGGLTLREMTSGRVERFCDDLKAAGISVPTTRKILGTLKQLLRFAVSRDLVATNVARDVRVIGRRDQGSRKIVPPTPEVMRQLMAVAGEDFRVQLIFAAATGVRAGEFHALRWHHIDLVAGEVRIETRVDAHRNEDVTKTAAGMREIPLGADVIAQLKAWKLRSRFTRAADLVFPNRRGQYESHENLTKRRFRPLFDQLEADDAADPRQAPKAPVRFNWHALRHFAISCWIEAGLSPKTVQTFAGHSSLQVTMDRYGHLFKSDNHRHAMDQIARRIIGR